MDKTQFLCVGDRIISKKYGRWTIVHIDAFNGYITMVKVRKGKVTETFKIRSDRLFS